MASQLLRSTLRAVARPTLAKTFASANVARRAPTVAFNLNRSFSVAMPRFGTGAGKFFSNCFIEFLDFDTWIS